MTEALVIHCEQDPLTLRNIYRTEVVRNPTLEDLQRLVGGLIEPIPTSPDVTIWVNEEGKYRATGGITPIPNLVAIDLWKRCDVYGCVPAGDWIAGTVVVQGGVDSDGGTGTCPQWVRDLYPDAGWSPLILVH